MYQAKDKDAWKSLANEKGMFLCGDHLLTAIWFMALQQCGTNILSDSAGWHWKQKYSKDEDNKPVSYKKLTLWD